MSIWDRVATFLALEPMAERVELTATFPDMETQVAAIRARTRPTGRIPSINEALSVPAIQRAVTLISHTVGSTSMQGWRNGSPMPETPVVLARPNPYEVPYDTYRDIAFNRATRGETILWIANRDGAGFPIALVNVAPWEVTVQPNPANRLRPTYYWGKPAKPGTIEGTRYSLANPKGEFVHIMYHRDVTGLRGEGPLQMCGLAVSVAVEAMQWASNFYTSGGVPPLIVKSVDDLDATAQDGGLNEAEIFKRDWMAGQPNEPKVIDQHVESVQQLDTNPQGAQMLDGRNASNGDVARMFGIPGVLLEYNMSGSSLTYQSIPDVWIELLRGCLAPTYFEPIEAHLSDLLPRTQAARFNTKGLQRADIKTRFDVYTAGIASGVMSVEQAQVEEGYLPGDIETMPVPPSPPAAVVGLSRGPVRCDGQVTIRGVLRTCNQYLADAAPFAGTCRRCGKAHGSEAPSESRELPREMFELVARAMARPEPQPVQIFNNTTLPEQHNHYAFSNPMTIENHVQPTPVEVHNTTNVEPTPIEVHNAVSVDPTPVTVENTVNVDPAPVEVTNTVQPTPVTVLNTTTVEPAPVTVHSVTPEPRTVTKRIVRDKQNQITKIVEEAD